MKNRKKLLDLLASLAREGRITVEEGLALLAAVDFAGDSIVKHNSPRFRHSFGANSERVIMDWRN